MPVPLGFLVASSLLTNLANREISKEQFENEKDMVDYQNEYNLPVNQLNRLKAAGINPANLGMGNGLVVQGNTSAGNNQYTPAFMQDPLASASNSMLAQMQASQANEGAISERTFRGETLRNIELQNQHYIGEIELLGLDARAQQIANDYASALNEVALMQGVVNINKTDAEIQEINKNIEQMEEYILHKLPAEVQKIVSETKLNVLEQDKVVALIQRIYAEKENIEQDTELKLAQESSEYVRQGEMTSERLLNEQKSREVEQNVQFFLDTYEDALTKFAAESKLSQKESRWFIAGKVLEGLRSIGGVAGGAAAAVKVFAK